MIIVQAMLREMDGTVAYRIERFLSETPITPAELQVSDAVRQAAAACVAELCGPPGTSDAATSPDAAPAASTAAPTSSPTSDAAAQLSSIAHLVDRYDPSDVRRGEPLAARLERVLAFHLADDGDTE
ncbi:MAG: hypothetical protein IT341_06925 [Chloroflexi bacterium]|nr:hypothetical protein [Chloroflexota bacterium]